MSLKLHGFPLLSLFFLILFVNPTRSPYQLLLCFFIFLFVFFYAKWLFVPLKATRVFVACGNCGVKTTISGHHSILNRFLRIIFFSFFYMTQFLILAPSSVTCCLDSQISGKLFWFNFLKVHIYSVVIMKTVPLQTSAFLHPFIPCLFHASVYTRTEVSKQDISCFISQIHF